MGAHCVAVDGVDEFIEADIARVIGFADALDETMPRLDGNTWGVHTLEHVIRLRDRH